MNLKLEITRQMQQEAFAVFAKEVCYERTGQKWFKQFIEANESTEDE